MGHLNWKGEWISDESPLDKARENIRYHNPASVFFDEVAELVDGNL